MSSGAPIDPRPDDPEAELAPGAVVGRYRIERTLGRGGMGVVYEAHDPELDRRVALKVLAAVADGSRVAQARLRREAQALAKLSHPNVVAVHDVGAYGDRIFLAMERIDGITLTAWLAEPRSFGEVLAVFRQAGEGLAAAHAEGLVHRDFKPDNVLVDRRGRVRVLDFGLARAADEVDTAALGQQLATSGPAVELAETVQAAEAPTFPEAAGAAAVEPAAITEARPVPASSAPGRLDRGEDRTTGKLLASPLTVTGTLLGTPLYMSPEQHMRSPTDARTDQFSFAVALYEALYGQRPFKGETLYHIRRSVLENRVAEPPKNRPVPEKVRLAVLRALRVSPADRFPSMEALLAELQVEGRASSRRLFIAGGVAAAGLAVAAAVAGAHVVRSSSPPPPVHYQRLTFNGVSDIHLSPDGRHIAYVRRQRVIVRDLESGAEKDLLDDGGFIHWISSAEVARFDGKKTLAASIDGGPPHEIPFEAARSTDGARALGFAFISKSISVQDVASGTKKTLPLDGTFTWLVHASFSPTAALLVIETEHEGKSAISTMALDGSPRRTLAEEARIGAPCFSPRGDAVYYVRGVRSAGGDGDLVKIRIDPHTGAALGPPEVVLSGINAGNNIDVSPDGKKLYFQRGLPVDHLWVIDTPRSPSERPRAERITTSAQCRQGLAVSPDGKRAVFAEIEAGVRLTAMSLDGGDERPMGKGDAISEVHGLAWSPAGNEVAVAATNSRDGQIYLYRASAGGGAFTETGLPVSAGLAWAPRPDILAQTTDNENYYVVDPATSGHRLLFPRSEGWPFSPALSADGKTAAFLWNRKDRSLGEGLWLVNVEDAGARLVVKRSIVPMSIAADGASVFGIDAEDQRKVVSVSIETGAVTPVMTLPFQEGCKQIAAIPGTSRFACLVEEGGSDLWVAEGFDPEAAEH